MLLTSQSHGRHSPTGATKIARPAGLSHAKGIRLTSDSAEQLDIGYQMEIDAGAVPTSPRYRHRLGWRTCHSHYRTIG